MKQIADLMVWESKMVQIFLLEYWLTNFQVFPMHALLHFFHVAFSFPGKFANGQVLLLLFVFTQLLQRKRMLPLSYTKLLEWTGPVNRRISLWIFKHWKGLSSRQLRSTSVLARFRLVAVRLRRKKCRSTNIKSGSARSCV